MTSFLSSINTNKRKKTPEQLVSYTKQTLVNLINAITLAEQQQREQQQLQLLAAQQQQQQEQQQEQSVTGSGEGSAGETEANDVGGGVEHQHNKLTISTDGSGFEETTAISSSMMNTPTATATTTLSPLLLHHHLSTSSSFSLPTPPLSTTSRSRTGSASGGDTFPPSLPLPPSLSPLKEVDSRMVSIDRENETTVTNEIVGDSTSAKVVVNFKSSLPSSVIMSGNGSAYASGGNSATISGAITPHGGGNSAIQQQQHQSVTELTQTLAKALIEMKTILYGDLDHPMIIDEEKGKELSRALQQYDLLPCLIRSLQRVSFESRKDIASIFHQLMKKDLNQFVSYFTSPLQIESTVKYLVNGYSQNDIALTCGMMLRECIRYDAIARYLLFGTTATSTTATVVDGASTVDAKVSMGNAPTSPPKPEPTMENGSNTEDPNKQITESIEVATSTMNDAVEPTNIESNISSSPSTEKDLLLWSFFDCYVHLPNFDVASDAFNTMKDLLTTPKNKQIAYDFFEVHCDLFLKKYELLLNSDNYVTKRRSLKLLSELLLDRNNYNMMMTYISSRDNLKTIMNLLRHKSQHIQLETFHVFKIFVANPKKTPEVASILYNNRQKLILYLETFHNEKDNEDIQFMEEKKLLIETLQGMSDPDEGKTPRHHHHHHHNGSLERQHSGNSISSDNHSHHHDSSKMDGSLSRRRSSSQGDVVNSNTIKEPSTLSS